MIAFLSILFGLGALGGVAVLAAELRNDLAAQRAQAGAREALLRDLYDLADLEDWSDDKLQSGMARAAQLRRSYSLAVYLDRYEDGEALVEEIERYRLVLAVEWSRRFKLLRPLKPAARRVGWQ